MTDATHGPDAVTGVTPDTGLRIAEERHNGGMVAADGTPLKRSLNRALRREKLRALALIAPLFLFIVVTFIAPIADMLFRSVENQIVSETLPRTVIALEAWDGEDTPEEPVFAALAQDLVDRGGTQEPHPPRLPPELRDDRRLVAVPPDGTRRGRYRRGGGRPVRRARSRLGGTRDLDRAHGERGLDRGSGRMGRRGRGRRRSRLPSRASYCATAWPRLCPARPTCTAPSPASSGRGRGQPDRGGALAHRLPRAPRRSRGEPGRRRKLRGRQRAASRGGGRSGAVLRGDGVPRHVPRHRRGLGRPDDLGDHQGLLEPLHRRLLPRPPSTSSSPPTASRSSRRTGRSTACSSAARSSCRSPSWAAACCSAIRSPSCSPTCRCAARTCS